MPLGDGFYGTDGNGSATKEYCKFCFQAGAFTMPDLTVEDMIKRSVDFMTKNLGIPAQKAEEMSRAVISGLKRWM
jgi:hypothetical protein